jgi:transposase-like protein
MLVVTTLWQQRPNGYGMKRLAEAFSMSRQTLRRWIRYFQEEFPMQPQWQRVRGRLRADLAAGELPGVLVKHFLQRFREVEYALRACACLLGLPAP